MAGPLPAAEIGELKVKNLLHPTPTPSPEVWPFGERGGEIAKTRFRRGEKNKKKAFFIAAASPPQ